jgi:hypothetical protein
MNQEVVTNTITYDVETGTGMLNRVFMRSWWKAAASFFLIASLLGLAMRYMFVWSIPLLSYKNILHAHSHVALMGWAFMLISGGLLTVFVTDNSRSARYRGVLAINVLACVGMTVSFPLQGYGMASILFGLLHLVSATIFSKRMLADLNASRGDVSVRFARWSVIWMLVSFIGLLAIGPVVAILGRLHPIYFMCIQWFLHFQLNGWLTFGVFAILLRHTGLGNGLRTGIGRGFWILTFSLILTFTLSVTWSTPVPALFYVNSLGVVVQAIAFGLILWPIANVLHVQAKVNDPKHWLLLAGLLALLLKVMIQIAVALPVVATISYTIKNYVIGFIHLIVLGSVTFSVAGVLLEQGHLPYQPSDKRGWLLILAGFVITEFLLMGQGTLLWMEAGFIPNYHFLLFLASIPMPVGISLVLTGLMRKSHEVRAIPI